MPRSTSYSLYTQVLAEEKIPFHTLIKELEPDYEISYHPQPLNDNPFPSILLISNDEMKRNFERFGKCTSFDLTFSLINEKPIEIKEEEVNIRKEYLLGFFAGVNNHGKIVIFACVITSGGKKEDMMLIFRTFFDHMRG